VGRARSPIGATVPLDFIREGLTPNFDTMFSYKGTELFNSATTKAKLYGSYSRTVLNKNNKKILMLKCSSDFVIGARRHPGISDTRRDHGESRLHGGKDLYYVLVRL
jgi:hypothetical protein